MSNKADVLKKIIECLHEQNIPVDAIYMNEATRKLFTTGKEPVRIGIDHKLEDGKFVYVKPGGIYESGSDNVFTFWGDWGGKVILSERLFSQKRTDSR